jgi:DNA polymerase-3 subunit epsilon
MLTHLRLNRPLVVIDLETTGTDPASDRIVEISVCKIFPDGRVDHRTRRVNPGVPIPEAASAIHVITDKDVAAEPRFARIDTGLATFLDGCDLCGFNIKRFDLRMLLAEFRRAGVDVSLNDRPIVDPMEIFHARERRDLAAAVRFYCGRDHDGAHGAAADALAAVMVLDAMLARYGDLPRTVGEPHRGFCDPDTVDLEGRFVLSNGRLIFNSGKHRGRPLAEIARERPDYLR